MNSLSSLCQAFAGVVKIPEPSIGEYRYLLLSSQQAEGMVPEKNYSTECFKEGVCYGIDRLNYTILTWVKFENSQECDDDESIVNKLTDAHFKGHSVTVRGFSSASAFMTKMKSRWNDRANPLRRAIEKIQEAETRRQLPLAKIVPKSLTDVLDGYTPLAEALAFEEKIAAGVPLEISIKDSRAHALTIYGFIKKLNQKGPPTKFIVSDSNSPGTLRILDLVAQREQDSQISRSRVRESYHWYYSLWDEHGIRDDTGRSLNGDVTVRWKPPSDDSIRASRLAFHPQITFGGENSDYHLNEMFPSNSILDLKQHSMPLKQGLPKWGRQLIENVSSGIGLENCPESNFSD